MKFEVIDTLPHPVGRVYQTLRDKLVDLVPYLPDVKSIECISREDLPDGRTKMVNHWHAEDKIPAALKSFIKPEQLGWIDHAEWDAKSFSVNWRLEMMFFKEYVDVHGHNTFTEENGKTTFTLRGELNLDLAKHPMVPRLLARTITGQVEKLVLALVKPNLVKVNRGVEKHLESASA
jgi:hypothetical protein